MDAVFRLRRSGRREIAGASRSQTGATDDQPSRQIQSSLHLCRTDVLVADSFRTMKGCSFSVTQHAENIQGTPSHASHPSRLLRFAEDDPWADKTKCAAQGREAQCERVSCRFYQSSFVTRAARLLWARCVENIRRVSVMPRT